MANSCLACLIGVRNRTTQRKPSPKSKSLTTVSHSLAGIQTCSSGERQLVVSANALNHMAIRAAPVGGRNQEQPGKTPHMIITHIPFFFQRKAEEQMKKLNEKIAATRQNLDSVAPQYEALRDKEEKNTQQLALAEQRRKELYAKQGRGNQFTSSGDRDKWITKELKSLTKSIKDKDDHVKRLREDLANNVKREALLETQLVVSKYSIKVPSVVGIKD